MTDEPNRKDITECKDNERGILRESYLTHFGNCRP
jgi:hypothetical protein